MEEHLLAVYGVKGLRNLKNIKNEVNESLKIDDHRNEISDEEYKHIVNTMDEFIKDIMRTNSQLRIDKIKETVKTEEDYMNFFNIKSKNENMFSPEPADNLYLTQIDQSNKFSTKINHEKNEAFEKIKEKLFTQEAFLKEKENLAFKLEKESLISNYDPLKQEIEEADKKLKDMMDSIDDIIKLGEEIDD